VKEATYKKLVETQQALDKFTDVHCDESLPSTRCRVTSCVSMGE
jgi:hypothetical protein